MWDARAGTSPLFVLQYHGTPVSDLLIGSRTGYLMISAGGDGSIATWDFRKLSGQVGEKVCMSSGRQHYLTQTIRQPIAGMHHCEQENGVEYSGPVLLSQGINYVQERSVISAGVDGKLKEWDISSGQLLNEHATGHNNAISCFSNASERTHIPGPKTQEKNNLVGGLVTASFDGTVRLRRLVMEYGQN